MSKISINLGTGKVNKENNLVVGIDLGTTNSLIAIFDQNLKKPVAITGDQGKHVITPSVVHFNADNTFTVGEEACEMLVSDPEKTVYSVKRLLGKSYHDVAGRKAYYGYNIIDNGEDSLVKIQLGNKYFTPIELSAEILKELKQKAEKQLRTKVEKVVITVPAYFNDAQRQATRDAGKLAGMQVLRIVNEPTAASLAYGLNNQSEGGKTIAVYDLGGGTFDISILRIEEGIFEVLSTHGNTYLGGDDIDAEIAEFWLAQHKTLAAKIVSKQHRASLRLSSENAKKHLSSNNDFETEFNDCILTLSRTQLEKLIQPIINSTLESCQKALKDADLDATDIEEVVLVGGSTRIPLVKSVVTKCFHTAHINDVLNPDEVVALGAAIEADILAGNRKDMLLLDVTPLSLGIETMGGLMDVIIPRNTKVPNAVGRNYTTSVDGQVNLNVAVYQGERDQVVENRKLAEFVLKNIPAMPAGFPKIEITFMLNADGILKVKAKELRSGVEQTVEVKPKYGLTDKEVEKMLHDSVKNAETDMAFRSLNESINEARYLILSTEKFTAKHTELLSTEEATNIRQLVHALQKGIENRNKDEILIHHDALNAYTKPFAEKVMDKTISKALKGKSIQN